MNDLELLLFSRFGNRIKTERKKLGYTQELLGSKANVHPKYISEIERGIKNPTINIMLRLSQALDIPLDDLLH